MFQEALPTVSSVLSILREYSSLANVNHDLHNLLTDSITSLDQLTNQFIFIHQHNSTLYMAFKNFTQQRFVSVENLIELISVDVDDKDEATVHQKEEEMTENQFNVLTQNNKEMLMSLFNSSLTMDTISELLNSKDFVKPAHSDDNNEKKQKLIHLLYKRLLLTNSKSFYEKFVSKCQTEAEKYKHCIAWMNRSEKEKQSSVVHCDHVDELSLLRSQLVEMRSAVVNLVGTFNDQIMQLTNRFENKLEVIHNENKAELECKLNAKTEEIQLIQNEVDFCHKTMKNMQSIFEASMKKQEEYLTLKHDENESVQRAMREEIQLLNRHVQQLQNEKSQAEKKRKEEIVALERKWQRCNDGNVKSQAEMKKQISLLENEVKSRKNVIDTITLVTSLDDVVWLGMEALVPDGCGQFPLIDWTKLKPEFDYIEVWREICLKEKDNFYFPLLLLPSQLGGWVIQFFIGWDDGLKLFGGLRVHDRNKDCPPFINVHLSITLNVEGIKPCILNKEFTIKKSSVDADGVQEVDCLGTFIGSTGKSWQIPTVSVKVFV